MAWDAAQPYRGLGWREIEAEMQKAAYAVHEHPVAGA
jgi:hypothetical protein